MTLLILSRVIFCDMYQSCGIFCESIIIEADQFAYLPVSNDLQRTVFLARYSPVGDFVLSVK